MSRLTILERAYEMARSGEHEDANAIAQALAAEHYLGVPSHFSGLILRRDLSRLCREAQELPPTAEPGVRKHRRGAD